MFKILRTIFAAAALLLVLAAAWFYFFKAPAAYNVLVLGTDEVEKSSRHSDTIILACGNLKEKKLSIMSIPRDSLVEYSGKYMKINTVYAANYIKGGHYKACNEVRKLTEKITGVSIPFFLQADYGGVRELVDLFGGVKVDITKRMHYTDKADGLFIDFKPGVQVLNGKDAVKYLRFRSDAMADLGRIERQQKFLVSFLEKAKAGVSVEKLPKIYGIIKKNVNTNIPPGDLLSVYRAYKDFRLSGTKRFTLPGEPALIDGSSYWKPDVWQGRKILRQEN